MKRILNVKCRLTLNAPVFARNEFLQVGRLVKMNDPAGPFHSGQADEIQTEHNTITTWRSFHVSSFWF